MTPTGKKYDLGKAEYGLIPPYALHEMVKVLTAGAQKYSRDNWKYVPDRQRRYFDALERHIWAWKRGEIFDTDDNLHHLAHAACCIFFLYEVEQFYSEVNNEQKSKEQDESLEEGGRGSEYGGRQKTLWPTIQDSVCSNEQIPKSTNYSTLGKSWTCNESGNYKVTIC